MGTAVTVTAIVAGALLLLVWLILRADHKDDKVQARHADLKRARQDLATARTALREIERFALELQALGTALATSVLGIIYKTREELEKA